MTKRVLCWLAIVGALWSGLGTVSTTTISADESNFRHAYYLFQTGKIDGCEDCYIPLLLTTTVLPQTTEQGSDTMEVDVIVTYERDSIWEIPANPRSVKMSDIEPNSRMIRMNGLRYRYQEVPLQEAIRLLKKPLGTIPISRPLLPGRPTNDKIQSLLKRLSVQ